MHDANGLLCGYDVEALRAKVRREPFRAVFEQMVADVRAAATKDLETDRLQPGGWCHSRYFTPRVLEAGFIHRMTGEPWAAAHVARQIDKLARVYADPPESCPRELGSFNGKPTAYFSNAHTCLAARMCGDALGDHYAKLVELARDRLIDDHHKPEYFFTHYNAGHNAVATHVISGAICAMVFGAEAGHPDAERIITLGRDACAMHAHWGFDDQGTPHEGPMYSLVTLEWVYLYADLLLRHGRENLFETLPRLATIAQAAAEMQLPGVIGYFGFDDCRQLITQHPMPWLLLTAKHYGRAVDLALWRDVNHHLDADMPHHQHRTGWRGLLDLLWWDGATPDRGVAEMDLPTAFFGQGKNVAMMRTSWSDDAVCACVLGQGRSHNVPDHTHADAGHFSIHAHGDYLAYDTAYFNFDEDTHSVMLIDDRPHAPARQGNQHHGLFRETQRHALLDAVWIDAAAAKGCTWAERRVLFVRGEGDFAYLVVLDNINVDNQWHNYKWQLQANMHCRIEVTGEQTATVHGDRARLECAFFKPGPEDYPAAPHTMKVWADDHEHRRVSDGQPETNPRLVAELEGSNGSMMALVVPRRSAEPRVVVRAAPGYRTFNVYVEHGDFIDQIVYACDHTLVRLADLDASSQVVVVRRDQAGGVLRSWTNDGRPAAAR